MDEHNLHTFAKYYDQIYLKRNDYKNESDVVQNIIRRFKRKPSKTLLDIGCGTGEHLKYLSQHFRCTGLARALTNDGLALVEPWVFKKDFRTGNVAIDTYEDEKIKLARMGTSKLTESHWLVHFHYLIGISGEIEHTKEIHKMIVADYEDYVKGFNLAGYKEITFLGENEWTRTRGLFVAIK